MKIYFGDFDEGDTKSPSFQMGFETLDYDGRNMLQRLWTRREMPEVDGQQIAVGCAVVFPVNTVFVKGEREL
jgi:hypothetical protein